MSGWVIESGEICELRFLNRLSIDRSKLGHLAPFSLEKSMNMSSSRRAPLKSSSMLELLVFLWWSCCAGLGLLLTTRWNMLDLLLLPIWGFPWCRRCSSGEGMSWMWLCWPRCSGISSGPSPYSVGSCPGGSSLLREKFTCISSASAMEGAR